MKWVHLALVWVDTNHVVPAKVYVSKPPERGKIAAVDFQTAVSRWHKAGDNCCNEMAYPTNAH
jgi:hypothetical protein